MAIEQKTGINYAQLITLYEVSRKINSQLNYKMLLDQIMDLAIELLRAEKGLLLFREPQTGELTVEVARWMDKRTIQDVVALSRSIISKVEKEGKPVLLQKVPETSGANASTSLARYKIKSVICVPLRAKNQFLGTIYLDTTKSEHFFKEDDLVFLEAFANLAAIAIENARSYHEIENLNANLENLVKIRTQELEQKHTELTQAYQELKDAQLHLIRSEKMASLGMLVAGVAHEINTPMGAITSNTDLFIRGFEKLRQTLSQNDPRTDESTKTMEVLESLSHVNKNACDRINQIVKSLKNFARLDEEELKLVNLHEGIDSTLSLIGHLSRDRIEIIKEYGKISKLRCRANQLNQVFMNILINACQAIPDKGKIKIKTFQKDSEIHIQFSDSGVGIPAENLPKIFDPGFTTKGVGVGTGLGLSISYRVVSDHHGRIDVESKVGKGTTFTVRLPLK
jgi:signal transduction histidine kinase